MEPIEIKPSIDTFDKPINTFGLASTLKRTKNLNAPCGNDPRDALEAELDAPEASGRKRGCARS